MTRYTPKEVAPPKPVAPPPAPVAAKPAAPAVAPALLDTKLASSNGDKAAGKNVEAY